MNSIKLSKRVDLGKSATWLWIIVAVIISICTYFRFDLQLSMTKLLFVIPGFYQTWTIVKQTKITLVEFAYDEHHFKFYFQWSFKDPITYNRSEVLIATKVKSIEFKSKVTEQTIGIIHKKQLRDENNWNLLVSMLE